jgi:hypothetical protein
MNCNVQGRIKLTGLSVDFAGADMMLSFRIGQLVDHCMDNAVKNRPSDERQVPFLVPDA